MKPHATSPGVNTSLNDHSKLKAYYARYSISLDDLQADGTDPYRYIRLHPAFDTKETLKLLKAELETSDRTIYPLPVPWLDPSFGFYAIPGDFRLSQSPTFKSGRIYGQDVSSGAAVAALLTDYHHRDQSQSSRKQSLAPNSSWRVLDLCCAPGFKLCAIADWIRQQRAIHSSLGLSSSDPMVVGVDVSSQRLAACQKIVQKHQIEPFVGADSTGDAVRIRLYHNDGVTFGKEPTELTFDSSIAMEERVRLGKRERLNKSARAKQKKKLKEISMEDLKRHRSGDEKDNGILAVEQFDRVLVDAECSTDGSLKHVKKRIVKSRNDVLETGAASTESSSFAIPQLTNERQLSELVGLQRGLAEAGFRMLKQGGFMVYSTCSFSEEQNEGVVKWLLEKHSPAAKVVPLQFANSCASNEVSSIKEGSVPGTLRFVPNLCCQSKSPNNHLSGGGFFLAKINKTL